MMKVTEGMVQKCFHKRKTSSHKGQNGAVLVVAGSNEYSGAAVLCALSAKAVLRAGVDLSILAAPEKAGWAASAYSPDLVVHKLKGAFFEKKHAKKVLGLSKKAGVLVIGNGLGLHKKTIAFVREIVEKCEKPLVIDADAIKVLKGTMFKNQVLITPHRKELEIFCGKKITKPRIQVKEIARKYNCVILLKRKKDYISDGKKVFYNTTGNEGMTISGTGDVLAGVCAAFVAHKNSLLSSACAAAYVNGLGGDRLLKKKGIGFTATDLVEELPFAMKKFWLKAK